MHWAGGAGETKPTQAGHSGWWMRGHTEYLDPTPLVHHTKHTTMEQRGASLLLGLCLVITVCSVHASNICQGNPGDIFFVLDSSSSITRPDFARQLNFVKGIVDILDVSSDMTRVGALSFSNWAFVEFHLDEFQTKEEVKEAIDNIHQIQGDTNTAAALVFMLDVAFSPRHGARAETVPRVAVVLTDGKSNKPWETASEAFRARLHGVHVFAIGIGDEVDLNELQRIASSPESKHVFHVSSYSALTSSMAELLAIETCKVTARPTTLPPPTTTTMQAPTILPTPNKVMCGDAELVDVVFGGSPNSSPRNTIHTLEFFRDVAEMLDTTDDRIHVGLVPKQCSAVPDLNVMDYKNKDEVIKRLERMQAQSSRKSPVSVLRHMRLTSFQPEYGARPEAKKMAVLVIDESDARSMLHVMREAFRMQMTHKAELFIVAVGEGLGQSDLEAMAPGAGHVIRVDSYDQLSSQVAHLRHLLCPTER